MKKVLVMVAAGLLLTLSGCNQEPKPLTVTKKVLADPELTLSGVPAAAIESGQSFTLTVESKSDADVRVSVDKPAISIVKAKGNLSFEVSATSLKNATVKVTVIQDENKTYSSAVKEATFNVTGTGDNITIPGPNETVSGTAVSFEEAAGNVVSPERGMYTGYEVYSDTEPLAASYVQSRLKNPGNSLWLLEFYLTDFMTSDISTSFMNKMRECFDGIREGGAKAIVRFAYRNNNNNANEDKEPKLDMVLRHIEQVKPILRQYEDVIFVLQAGFIGTWGEWYYTTHISSMTDRKKVTDALLEALPSSRQVELRTPSFKMGMYGLALKDTLTAATAHDGSSTSRLAGHNDCFGADKNDKGTFDSETARKFWMAESRYTIMGGETCEVSDYCLCPATLKDLKDYHWTYLHDGYRQEVLSRWSKDGCLDEIRSRLGYRLVLSDVHYEAIEAGKPCKVTIRFQNKGFAAPMNPREAWLVWVTPDGKTEKSFLGADPRTWHSGYNAVVSYFTPSTAKGTLYLELSDPLLSTRPEYSLALANKDVFDAKTGYNKLFEVK